MKKIHDNLIPKWRIYGETIVTQWILAAIFLVYWFVTDHALQDLFIFDDPLYGFQTDVLLGIGLGIASAVVIILLVIYFSETIKSKVADVLSDESIQFLIPSRLSERFLFFLVALTAGVCEEIIFRAGMLHYLEDIVSGIPLIVTGIISSVLFGLIHLYQGWKGVLQTAYIGAIFFFLFVVTGSLWVPIALHFLMDAKLVFLPNKKKTSSL